MSAVMRGLAVDWAFLRCPHTPGDQRVLDRKPLPARSLSYRTACPAGSPLRHHRHRADAHYGWFSMAPACVALAAGAVCFRGPRGRVSPGSQPRRGASCCAHPLSRRRPRSDADNRARGRGHCGGTPTPAPSGPSPVAPTVAPTGAPTQEPELPQSTATPMLEPTVTATQEPTIELIATATLEPIVTATLEPTLEPANQPDPDPSLGAAPGSLLCTRAHSRPRHRAGPASRHGGLASGDGR